VHHGHGYWYCHLQREFCCYPIEINSDIERAYQNFVGGSSSKSNWFLLPMGTYRIEFRQWVQIALVDSSRYRTVRRIGLRGRISDSTYLATPIPLSFQEIVSVGGHPKNYLSTQELAAQLVKGQCMPDFFPEKISAAGVARDSLSRPKV
jgi:hypothetical protein